MNGFLTGERFQASLGGRPQSFPTWLLDSLRGSSAQIVSVQSVDYARATVSVYNSNGPRVARVLKSKSSKNAAGHIDLPNVGDVGVILPVNGDAKSAIWIGSLNTVEFANSLEKDENFTSVSDLTHRAYWKHETGTFWLLDRLGAFMAKFKKKAATEDSPAKKNLDIVLSNLGVLQVTHYRGDDKAGYQFSADQAGNITVTLFKADGTTPAVTFQADESGNATYTHAGDMTVNADGDTTINGGEEVAFKSALEALKAQVDQLAADHNAHKIIYTAHAHTSAAPGNPTSPSLVPDVTPVVLSPISPTGTLKTKVG